MQQLLELPRAYVWVLATLQVTRLLLLLLLQLLLLLPRCHSQGQRKL
jgi:hypothetical protein